MRESLYPAQDRFFWPQPEMNLRPIFRRTMNGTLGRMQVHSVVNEALSIVK